MKTFQMNGQPNTLEFTNYERVSEVVLFNMILRALTGNPKVKIGEKQIGPSEDYYACSLNDKPFTLYFDLSDGPSIYAKDTGLIDDLTDYFDSVN